jgi:Putative Actinobacterial Holin-X, holin superfamily III
MPDPDEPRGERQASIPGMARELVGGIVQLVRLEVTRARQEIGGMLAETRLALVLFAIAAALGLMALVTLDVAVVLGTAALFDVIPDLLVVIVIVATFTAVVVLYVGLGAGGVIANPFGAVALLIVVVALAVPAYFGFSPAWMAALFVLFVQVALAGVAVARGIGHVKIGAPDETIASVKEDIAWAKRLLRRG